ncbi:MAG: energy transducer TonB [Polymorphobacter sp.]
MTSLLKDRLRDSTGLAVTLAVHLGVGAIALLAVTVAVPTAVPPPIITKHIPEPVKADPAPPPPLPTERPIVAQIDEPIVIIDNPAPQNWQPRAPAEPVIAWPGSEPIIIDPPRPAGPTQIARFDPRYALAKQPPYPATARRLAEEGAVVVHVRIGPDGRVLAATLARSSGSPRLDAAALDHALKRWRFTPALQDGVAVAAERDITVNFRLADA